MAVIPQELDELIKEYLTDGVITTKERQVLLKKAQQLGLDLDEVDLYIDAQQQKVDQEADLILRKSKGKVCPFCGAPVPQLADKCPECGQFITPEASQELTEILDALEEALVDLKSGNDIQRSKAKVERYSHKASLYYSHNPKVKSLLQEVEEEKKHAMKLASSKSRNKSLRTIFLSPFFIALIISLGVFLYGNNVRHDAEQRLKSIPETHSQKGLFSSEPQTEWERVDSEAEWAGIMSGVAIFWIMAIGIGVQVYVYNQNKKK